MSESKGHPGAATPGGNPLVSSPVQPRLRTPRLTQHTDPIPVGDLPEFRIPISPTHELLHDSWQTSGILQVFRHDRAVKVRAESNAVDAHLLNQVVDVIDHDRERKITRSARQVQSLSRRGGSGVWFFSLETCVPVSFAENDCPFPKDSLA